MTATADDAHPPCGRDFRAEAWLASQERVWERRLAQLPGYEPSGTMEVCQEAEGIPHVVNNLGKGQIHLPSLHDAEKYLSLAHEYLHWAFRHHPVARNERWIEGMARVLVLGEEEWMAGVDRVFPSPITLEAPLGGWRNSFGEEVAYTQVVRYPASRANTEEPANESGRRKQQTALIRGSIGQAPKMDKTPKGVQPRPTITGQNPPHTLVVNGVPMPLLLNDGNSFSRPYFFGTGSNGVEIRSPDRSAVVRRQFYEAYNEKLRPRLRIVLAWDSNATDIDLHVLTPKGEHCFYGNRSIPSGGALDVDVTTGYGPEIFAHPAPPPGNYLVYVNYYGGGWRSEKQGNAPITVATITVVSEEGTPDEKLQTHTIPMRRPGELVEVARFVY